MISLERLKELLSYDPGSGNFTWRVARRSINWTIEPGVIAGSLDSHGYRKIGIDRKRYYAHRLAWFYVHGIWPSRDLDHINGTRDHNSISNLRPATRSQNMANSPVARHNTSGLKGVSYKRDQRKWAASISVNNRNRYLGAFDTPEKAHEAYCAAAAVYFGAFARTR